MNTTFHDKTTFPENIYHFFYSWFSGNTHLEFSCYAPAAAAQILAKNANIFMTSREFYIQKNKTKNKFFSLFSMFVF